MLQDKGVKVLIVDDSITIRNVIEKHLGEDYIVMHASDGDQAWQLIEYDEEIVLIFADLQMPVMNGMLLLKQIRESNCKRISQLPVIMITGHDDPEAVKRASYSIGATDFISKPFSELDIISRAQSYTRLSQQITTLEQNNTRDSLTEMPNRRGLQDFGDKALAGILRHKFDVSILVLQIAEIEQLTADHGKDFSEKIITSIADSLKQSLRQEETLSHCDSGRFVIILPMTNAFKAHIVALRIQKKCINLAFESGDEKLRVKIAIGINSTEGKHRNLDFAELLKQCETVLQISLIERECKIVRYDEVVPKDLSHEAKVEQLSSIEDVDYKAVDTPVKATAVGAEVYSQYMAAIMSGAFDSIPEKHIEDMIKPLEDFLDFTRNRSQKGVREVK